MTAVISGEADIGFMGSEASVYMYSEGASDYVTFCTAHTASRKLLVARQDNEHFFSGQISKGKTVLGG